MFDTIMNTYQNNLDTWKSHIKNNQRHESDFLFLIVPFMEYSFITLRKIKLTNVLVSDDVLTGIIFQDFHKSWVYKLLRPCVLEMHDAKQLQLLKGETSELRFRHFVSYLTDPEMRIKYFEKYPVLQKKLVPFVKKQIHFFGTLLKRLDADFKELTEHCAINAHTNILNNIIKAGDAHGHGNSVSLIYLMDKKNVKQSIVVYKPRAINTDVAYYKFLAWLNKFSTLQFRCLKLIAKKLYGWCEYIEQLPCQTSQELSNYYYRLGSLLAVSYLLQGADIHYENIIVNGEQPIIIDLECFCIPKIELSSENAKLTPHSSRHSVIHISILPERRMFGPKSSGVDMSAFNYSVGQKAPNLSLVIENSGSDEMRVLRKEVYTTQQSNVPKIDNEYVNPFDYDKDFVLGFKNTYQIFLQHKKVLLGKNNPLLGFLQANSRLVFRPTMEYMTLLTESYHPCLLHEEEAYLKHFDVLDQNTTLNLLVNSEKQQLLEDDIPAYYCANTSKSNVLDAYDNSIAIKIVQPGYQKIQAHLKQFINEKDLKIQLKLITQTFTAARINFAEDHKKTLAQNIVFDNVKHQYMSQANTIAKKILDEICELTIIDGDKIYWPQTHTAQSIWMTSFTDLWLYKGLLGIALTFAYADKVFTNLNYRKIVKHAILNLEVELQMANQQNIILPYGAFNGVGGILYFCGVLAKLEHYYDLENLLSLIMQQLDLFMQAKEPIMMNFDIIAGIAGLLMCLLNNRHVIPEQKFNQYVDYFAFYIINHYPEPSRFPDALNNQTMLSRPQLGFSHGTAGIAWALFHFYNYRKINVVKEWIDKALAYERSFYSAEYQSWPNFKDMEGKHSFHEKYFPSQWCHGATGIGMARLDMYQSGWHDDHIAYEINVAINSTIKHGFSNNFNLCHGAIGNIEFILQAKQQKLIKENEYHGYVKKILMLLNDLQFPTEVDANLYTVGLMTGRAGVAYQLLRLAQPEVVPNVLLLQN